MNVGLRGGSVSVGGRGASINMSSRGVYANTGIPGTGLSYRTKLSGSGGNSSSPRRYQQRIEREKQMAEVLRTFRAKLDEKGNLQLFDESGELIKGKLKTHVWTEKKELLENFLQKKMEAINEDSEDLIRIHEETPSPDDTLEYELLEFDQQKPLLPLKPNLPTKPIFKEIAPLSFFGKIFKQEAKYLAKKEAHLNNFNESLQDWEKRVHYIETEHAQKMESYNTQLSKWEIDKVDFDNQQRNNQKQFSELLKSDKAFMENVLDERFSSLSWPRETLISYNINGDFSVDMDIDLPEIEDLPQKQASLASSGKKLNIKDKPQATLRMEYATHIHGIALKIIGTVFSTLPACDKVTLSGYSQRLNTATGSIEDEYLYSVRVTRKKFEKINFSALEKVNPIDALESFEIIKKMTKTGVFKAIEPFSN